MDKRSKRSREELTEENCRELAAQTVVGNDADWENVSEDERIRRDNLDRLAKLSFWRKIKVDDGFFDKVKAVLPIFWKQSVEGSSGRPTKTKVMESLKPFLVRLDEVAKKTSHDTINQPPLDFSEKSRYEILATFIELSEILLGDAEEGRAAKRAKTTSQLFSTCGTTCATILKKGLMELPAGDDAIFVGDDSEEDIEEEDIEEEDIEEDIEEDSEEDGEEDIEDESDD